MEYRILKTLLCGIFIRCSAIILEKIKFLS